MLRHLADPVKALRDMARYCKPGGHIAVRDADYGAMAWYPQLPGVSAWFTTYCRSARATGGEPDAGRQLRAWANATGLEITYAGASTWTYATPEATAWWGNTQADRVLHSTFAERTRAQGLTDADLQIMARDWRTWGQDPDAWFFPPHGELIVVNSSWSKSSLARARLLLLHLIFASGKGGKVAPHPRRQRFGVNDVEHFHVVLPEVATTSTTTLRFRVARPIE